MEIFFIPPGPCCEILDALRDITNRIARHCRTHSTMICWMAAARARENPDEQANDLEMAAYPGTD